MKNITEQGAGGRTGILLAQMGSPESPTKEAVASFLREFLSDPLVVETNRLVWWLVLNCIILPTRPSSIAERYRRIWLPKGSPLRYYTERQAAMLNDSFMREGDDVLVSYAMRYGKPSIPSRLDALVQAGCSKILFFPLYPQYSRVTTGSACDAFYSSLMRHHSPPSVTVVAPYYNREEFIDALSAVIRETISPLDPAPEVVLLSYHGMPRKSEILGDPYFAMCNATTAALTKALQDTNCELIQSFQSRFGREEWFRPYTDETVIRLARKGVKRVAVAFPGFVSDCLETLHEIGIQLCEDFRKEGGKDLILVPCLNDHPRWIRAMRLLAGRPFPGAPI